ncbi:MAG: hypothetical protein AB1768_20905, partial [Pseudomonadota bacterium]
MLVLAASGRRIGRFAFQGLLHDQPRSCLQACASTRCVSSRTPVPSLARCSFFLMVDPNAEERLDGRMHPTP